MLGIQCLKHFYPPGLPAWPPGVTAKSHRCLLHMYLVPHLPALCGTDGIENVTVALGNAAESSVLLMTWTSSFLVLGMR